MNQIRIIILFLLISRTTSVTAQQVYWQQEVNYTMNVKLDPTDNSLQASARIVYVNHSPDTLRFIWFHLWPNAYKNDKTAFSDQLLENGRTDFYFSDNEQRGYINRLDFRINDKPVQTEDHPEHIDIVKLILPSALNPGDSLLITTPFHVKLPYNFSRGGYNGKTYQITQWYPKAAVYDARGWHAMPYLDQGEFYADFGKYDVTITVPEKFVVAATGEPQFAIEDALYIPKRVPKQKPGTKKKLPASVTDWQKMPTKTYSYVQEKAVDFAWFADTTFTLQKGSVTLPSGKEVQLRCYFHLQNLETWANAINFMKDAIQYHSTWIGEYPYSSVTVVDGQQGFEGGMEYPTITLLTGVESPKELDLLIFHELGHNWFQATLASNERKYPWMDEGMNTFYDYRYEALKYPIKQGKRGFDALFSDPRIPELLLRNQVRMNKDQPMMTPSDSLTAGNYNMIAYNKSALWMKRLEATMGTEKFDATMQTYYDQWKFKHPYPEDFESIIRSTGGSHVDSLFQMLGRKGNINPEPRRPVKIVPLYQLRESFTSRPIFVMPIALYNAFNGFMPGIAIHNYSLPLPRFNFAMMPMFGLKSKRFNGWSRFAYQWYPNGTFSHIEAAVIAASFSQQLFKDSAGQTFNLGTSKLAPSIKFTLKEPYARSTMERFVQLRFFRIAEDQINYLKDPMNNEEIIEKIKNRYNITQFRTVINNYRKLYPYRGEFLAELNKEFMRFSVTGNYFFNFRKKGGVNLRLFAGKFIYLATKNINTQFELQRYNLTMSGPKGDEDYTYSAPFIGRNENSGLWSQQIMPRDGFFKVRTDLLATKPGVSDNWLTAANLTVDVPDRLNPLQILPIKIPLKLFADFGTSSTTWNQDGGSRLLYDGGIQISMLNNLVNFYFPLVYSSVYRDYFKSTPGNNFFQRVSFSINILDLSFRQISQQFAK
ncbi:MAG: M1 family metallopeptidase [Sphingobacteriales bacterium]